MPARARLPEHLKRRNGLFSYYRRVPRIFADVDPRAFVEVALRTRDERRAIRLRDAIDREQEAYWRALKQGESDDARERYLGAIERAKLEGFEYRPAAEIASGDLQELLARLARLEQQAPQAFGAPDAPRAPGEASTVAALLGTATMPQMRLSEAYDVFEKMVRDRLTRKSPDQLRRWRAPRRKAIGNFIALVGDKAVSAISRSDALAFRAWWLERVVDHGLTANAANKDIGHIAQVVDTLNDKLELGIGKPFARLRVRDAEKKKRQPYSSEQILAIIAEPRHLAGLNAEARGILLTMVETGMRPIEICSLDSRTIVLDHEIPHVSIEPADDRELKTEYSRRTIPLIGVSLATLRQHPNGFPRYRDKSAQLSATVNKHLKLRGLRPTRHHSLYSLRHAFKDRLRDAGLPEELMDRLMGHKNPKPDYGAGWTLERQREWLLKAAITETPAPPDPDQGALFQD